MQRKNRINQNEWKKWHFRLRLQKFMHVYGYFSHKIVISPWYLQTNWTIAWKLLSNEILMLLHSIWYPTHAHTHIHTEMSEQVVVLIKFRSHSSITTTALWKVQMYNYSVVYGEYTGKVLNVDAIAWQLVRRPSEHTHMYENGKQNHVMVMPLSQYKINANICIRVLLLV